MPTIKRTSQLSQFLLLAFVLTGAVFATGGVDLGFNPFVASTNSPNEAVLISVVQPDGKILIGGSFNVIGNHPLKGIARLNADGSVDTSFNPPEIDGQIFETEFGTGVPVIRAIALQPDGKILIGGTFKYVNGLFQKKLVRLNPDGSPDTAFNTAFHQQIVNMDDGDLADIKALPNGQFLIGGNFWFTPLGGSPVNQAVSRINADGSYDPTLNTSGIRLSVYRMKVLADGRIMVCGYGGDIFNYVGLVRLHSTGAIDFSFSGVPVKTGPHPQAWGGIHDFEVLSNGQVLIGGSFTTVSNVPRGNFARLNSNGSLDTTFNNGGSGTNTFISRVEAAGDGKILLGGSFTNYNGQVRNGLVRLNPDASVDNTFNYNPPGARQINTSQIQADGSIFVGGSTGVWDKIEVLTSGGTVQPLDDIVGVAGLINSIVQQDDGKILIGGKFGTVAGVRYSNIARLNLDGSIDGLFNPSPVSAVSEIGIQPEGKIIVASLAASTPVRLNADGTNDPSFVSPVTGPQRDIAVLPDGKIIVVGELTVPGNGLKKLVKLDAHGAVDGSFNIPDFENGLITRVLSQPDGKILVLGWFNRVNGVSRERIARLNSDGTLDPSFLLTNPAEGGLNGYSDMALQPDGKLIAVGSFSIASNVGTAGFTGRFSANGTLETEFARYNWPAAMVRVQADGKVLIGGGFVTAAFTTRRGIARYKLDGTLDASFNSGIGSNNAVTALAVQSDGKILAGGQFTRFKGISKVGLVRLNAIASTPFDFDGDGRADISVYRSSTNRWYEALSSGPTVEETFGTAGDIVTPADFDGDTKTDEAIFRPSNGQWWYKRSIDDTHVLNQFGEAGDIPRPADFDGDGKADLVLFRPSNNTWYRFGSTAGHVPNQVFGIAGDQPVVADFDGDGKSDIAIFRPSNGDWWYAASSAGGAFQTVHWGQNGDIPVPADYDADSKTDFAIFRPSDGGWYIYNSGNGSFTTLAFGLNGDRPVAADYDGDGRADIAVFRPSTGIWYLLRTTAGFAGYQFGISTDTAIPGALIP